MTTAPLDNARLYRLLAWLSPSYPVGAFSYSHGIETAIEQGFVTDRASLVAWIEGLLRDGTGRVDGALFAAAWRAASDGDDAALDAVAELAGAWRSSGELALESRQQGGSFLSITRAAWPSPLLDAFAERHAGVCALTIAVAVATAAHGVPLAAALTGYLHAFVANLVSAALRAVPLGQTDGQLALAALAAAVDSAATRAQEDEPLDRIGSATPLHDWCSMRHETQYTRLFRS